MRHLGARIKAPWLRLSDAESPRLASLAIHVAPVQVLMKCQERFEEEAGQYERQKGKARAAISESLLLIVLASFALVRSIHVHHATSSKGER